MLVDTQTDQSKLRSAIILQLGLTALRKAEKHNSSFQQFIDHALDIVPDLQVNIYACAVEGRFLQKPAHTPPCKAVLDTCEDTT